MLSLQWLRSSLCCATDPERAYTESFAGNRFEAKRNRERNPKQTHIHKEYSLINYSNTKPYLLYRYSRALSKL